jgi:aspartate/methionine/tyrosine aminotransferase
MFPIKPSHTKHSNIIATGIKLSKAMKETGCEYLMLNRGINSVVPLNLNTVIPLIDFNSADVQAYPGSNGKIELRKAINAEYFNEQANPKNILITGGGISGLDICLQNLDVSEILLPPFFWGTYAQLCNLRNLRFTSFPNYEHLANHAKYLNNKAVIICDPGNPLGEKYPDNLLLDLIRTLNNAGATIIFDSPYRRLFYDHTDTFYQNLLQFEQVIIIESFSKSVGLSGQRIGFLHSQSEDFNNEASLRLTYATNGINSFAQVLITKLLTSAEGKAAVAEFKRATIKDLTKNIQFLNDNNLIASNLYNNTIPLGIFAVINRSPQELFEHKIGSVGLDYFINEPFAGIENLSRILVSYPHEKFVSFFRTLC